MSSTYSPSLGIELIGQGDQSGTWGITTNNNLGTLIEQAIVGVETITMSNASYTMSFYQGASDEARNAVLQLVGTNSAPQNLIAPGVQKVYLISNQTGNTVNITTGSGSSAAVLNGTYAQVYCDGTNFYNATPSGNNVVGNLSVSGSGAFGNNVSVTNNLTVGANVAVTGSISAGSFTGITGRIVQIVSGSFTSGFSTTSGSPTPTGFTLNITPTSVSSNILVLYSGPFGNPQGAGGQPSNNSWLTMYRNGTNLAGGGGFMADLLSDNSNLYSSCAVSITDSPASTSLLTYQPYIWSQGNGALIYGCCTMTLLEIL
jgi:hypothetical protein